jgi:transcriptional regulator with XRE-family HTH domain
MGLFGEAVALMPGPSLSELLGVRLKQLRKEQGLTQGELGRRIGVATSTISKVENNQLSPTFETLLKLAEGLEIDIAELLAVGDHHIRRTRRAITPKGQGDVHETPHYTYELLCTELTNKKMYPLVARLKAYSATEFGPLFRHPGEELFYVLAGQVELRTEHYRPQRLGVGDCAYFDSTMGHACISTGDEDALIFWVSTVPRPNS